MTIQCKQSNVALRYVAAAASTACVGSVILFQFNPVFQLIFKVGLVLISPSGFYQLQNTPVVVFLLLALCYVLLCILGTNEKKEPLSARGTLTHTCQHSCTNTLARSTHKYLPSTSTSTGTSNSISHRCGIA